MALGFAQDRIQAIEVGLLNYLWPCLTVAMMVLSSRQRANLWLAPGLLLSLLGVACILGGGEGWSPAHIAANAAHNPLSYGLALFGAVLWAVYCTAAKPLARGMDAIVPFFVLTSVVFWLKFALSGGALPAMGGAGAVVSVQRRHPAHRLAASFWQGAAMVTAGSLCCWWATRRTA